MFLGGMMLILFSLSDCKKPEDIGISTLPEDDLTYTDYSDTATISTFTIKEDSLRSDELSRNLFGSIKDQDFGLTDVSFFGQLLLSSTPNLISDSTQTYGADSLMLSIPYAGYYGDTTLPVNIHVYRLTEDMYFDSTYYSNKVFQTDPEDLAGGVSFNIRPYTPVTIGTDTNQVPQIRIKLSDALRDSIFGKNNKDEFANNDNWRAYFKGLQIKVDQASTNGGLLVYFNAGNSNTKMTLYYHEGTVPKSYSFTMSGAATVTNTAHDFTGSKAEEQLLNPTTPYEINYLKPLAGLKTVLSFPYLKHFVDSGSILINKAELVINVLTDTITVPNNILLLAKNASNEYEFPIDYYERSYGGGIELLTRTYTFNVSRTVQHILDGTAFDYGFSLNILGSMISGNSAAIGGGMVGNSQMKLKLYYTKLH